jgi:peptidoglycan/LPS O-acetylase OafA/YrhL
VVAFHAGLPVRGGSTGVDVFFVISGFVIAGTLRRELEATNRLDLARFYVRRIKRLLPALAAMLIVVALAGILLDPSGTGRVSGLTGIFASLFAANFYLYSLPSGYFAVSTQLDPLLHTWTLAVEEQFYLVFPAILVGSWYVGARLAGARTARRTAFAVIAAGSLVSLALAVLWSGGWGVAGVNAPYNFAFYASPARAWEFGIGAILSIAASLLRRLPMLAAAALAAAGVALISLGAAISSPNAAVLTSPIMLAVVGAAALIAAGTAGETQKAFRACSDSGFPFSSGTCRTAGTSGTGR